MKISPEFTDKNWQDLNLSLDSSEEKWQKAIEIFKDRIKGRFLKPVNLIQEYEYAGFAVLALDCLLIETLQQFREGVPRTPDRQSKTYFVNFLTETSFGFTKEQAEMFYEQIRCGILHQAETKGNSKIRITSSIPLVQYTDDRKALIINRTLFHKQLEQEFESYIKELLNPNNRDLRKNFKKKMDFICRLSAEVD